ncbi:MAG: flavin reductase family protein [Thermosphaera sp.]
MKRLLYPLRTFLIVSGRIGEEVNVMAADWVTVVSADPFMLGVSISPKRYTHKLITRYKEFVLSVPTIKLLREVWIAGTRSGPGKLSEMKITLEKSRLIGVPSVKEAVANLECRVVGSHDYGDHTLFIGEVVAYSFDENAFHQDEPIPGSGFILHLARNKFTVEDETVLRPD